MAQRLPNIAYKELWTNRKYNRGPLLIIEILRNALGIIIIGIWVNHFFSTLVALLVAIPVVILVMIIFSSRIQTLYRRLEGSFLSNLNARERAASANKSLASEVLQRNQELQPALDPWDAHIVDLEVSQQAVYAGKSLSELGWRERFGINVAYLKRGEKLIHAPGRDQKILPFDHVGIIATDEQLQSFMPVFDTKEQTADIDVSIEDIALQKIVIDEHTDLRGRSLRDSGIREQLNGLVVGIERDGQRILNPDASTVFKWDDVVWVVGERKLSQYLREK